MLRGVNFKAYGIADLRPAVDFYQGRAFYRDFTEAEGNVVDHDGAQIFCAKLTCADRGSAGFRFGFKNGAVYRSRGQNLVPGCVARYDFDFITEFAVSYFH